MSLIVLTYVRSSVSFRFCSVDSVGKTPLTNPCAVRDHSALPKRSPRMFTENRQPLTSKRVTRNLTFTWRAATLVALAFSVLVIANTSFAQVTLSVTDDAYVNQQSQNTNFGGNSSLRLRRLGGPPRFDAIYIKFNMASLPPGTRAADIRAATLKLYVNSTTSGPGTITNLSIPCSNWSETTITYNLQPSSCGTSSFVSNAIWATGQYASIDVTEFVKSWVDANFGIVLSPSQPSDIIFSSKESSSNPPIIEVDLAIRRVNGTDGLTGGGSDGDIVLSIADGGVTNPKLADTAVTTPKLADGAVVSSKIANGAVGNAQLGVNYAGSSSQGGAATSALIANDAQLLGGIAPSGYAPASGSTNYVSRTGTETITGAKTFQNLQQFTGQVGIGQHTPLANELLSVGGNTGAVAGVFSNASNSSNDALVATHAGPGNAFRALNTQFNGRAGFFETTSSLSTGPTLEATGPGVGATFKSSNTGTGLAALFNGGVTINGGLNLTGTFSSTHLGNPGTINDSSNPIDWTKLKNVPISIASGQFVNSLNGLSGGVSLAAGDNISITPTGNTLTISSSIQNINVQQIALLRWYGVNTTNSPFVVGNKPVGLAFDGSSMWVANLNSDNVMKLRASDGAQLGTFAVGSLPAEVAFDGANIWVTNHGGGNVSKLQANDGTLLGTYTVGSNPFGIAFDGANIWVANTTSGNVTKLRATDGTNLGIFAVGASPIGIAFDGANIWVTNHSGNNVWKLQGSDGSVLGNYVVGSNPYGIAYDGANMWVANENSNTVTKLRVNDGAVLGTYAVGNVPRSVVFDGMNIWVSNAYSFDVTKLRASDGALLGTYPVGSFPEKVAFDGVNIWVANGGSNNLMKR